MRPKLRLSNHPLSSDSYINKSTAKHFTNLPWDVCLFVKSEFVYIPGYMKTLQNQILIRRRFFYLRLHTLVPFRLHFNQVTESLAGQARNHFKLTVFFVFSPKSIKKSSFLKVFLLRRIKKNAPGRRRMSNEEKK